MCRWGVCCVGVVLRPVGGDLYGTYKSEGNCVPEGVLSI